jgi:UDP-N-acetylglucosamine 3-dehydrogenase
MIKIGVIGTGTMGKNHARVCAELPNIELVGIADTNNETVKMISKRFDINGFTDYQELLPKTDAVIIATPTSTHFDIAMKAMDLGKHVLVEKPICRNIEKAEKIIKKAESEGLKIAIGHIERHNPAVGFVKNGLNNNSFGSLVHLSSKRVSSFPGRIRDVGVIFDFGVHDIDVMRYLAGEVESVYASAGCFNKKIDFEDHATIMLNFENNLSGTLEVNWLTPVKIRRLQLTCSEKFVEIDYIKQFIEISSSSYYKVDEMNLYNVPINFEKNNVSLQKKEPLKNEISDFIDSIENNKEPLVTGYDGMMAIKIAEAAVDSFRKKERVKIL